MPKETLRDKLEGNTLDLSLSHLENVPVKELMNLPKGTHLDLSCNLLISLPDNFCLLTHITRLDLSKNSLKELPKDFGNLENLQQLDLLGNELVTLPRSFCNLKRLKWLDLKDNPLEEGLMKNAGDCLDESQCRKCAIRILMYMTDLDAQLELQMQKKLKKKQDQETKKKAAAEKEQQRKRAEKKAEKEKRRRELEAKRALERKSQNADSSEEELSTEKDKAKHNGHKPTKKSKEHRGGHCLLFVLFSFLTLFVALLVAIDFHCEASLKDQLCSTYWRPARKQVVLFLSQSWNSANKFYSDHIEIYFNK